METLITILVGVLVTVAVYLLLSKSLVRVILGTAILSHAVHLLLMTMGGLKKGAVPLLGENAESYTDALPQALILTAIVISFAVTSIFTGTCIPNIQRDWIGQSRCIERVQR